MDVMDIEMLERRTLGALVWNEAGNFLGLTRGMDEHCFTEPLHIAIFKVLHKRATEGLPLNDGLMVWTDLMESGQNIDYPTLMEVLDDNTKVGLIDEYIDTLCDLRTRRNVLKAARQLTEDAGNSTVPIMETLTKAVNALTVAGGLREGETLRLDEALSRLWEKVMANAEGKTDQGMRTGIDELDRCGGLHTQDLVIIGGWSSNGKTSLAMTLASNVAHLSDTRVLIFSLEMGSQQLASRLLSHEARIPGNVILYRSFQEQGRKQVQEAIERMQPVARNIYIGDSSAQSLESILAGIRLYHARFGTRLVVVDYLQIIALGNRRDSNREELLAEAARRLKNIARELDICVVLLSQMNREGLNAAVPEPSAAQLRGSGQINEAADLTLVFYRPEIYRRPYPAPFQDVGTHDTALVKVEKDRNGGYGGPRSFLVHFDPPTTWVSNYIPVPMPPVQKVVSSRVLPL